MSPKPHDTTVQELIDMLKKHDPDAVVYIQTYRHDLEGDLHKACDAVMSPIDDAITYDDRKGVFLLEGYRRSYM